MTICLRVKFKYWNERCVFQSDPLNLQIFDYKVGGGGFYAWDRWFGYDWSDVELESATTWTSICVTFNTDKSSINIFINGANIGEYHHPNVNRTTLNFTKVNLGHCDGDPVSGLMTDFNVWNRLDSKHILVTTFFVCVHLKTFSKLI